MRVVVTGGTGFVGAHLARGLAARGDEVTCLDVVRSSPLLDGIDEVQIVRCDVSAWAETFHALKAAQPEIVFHSAGILSAFAEERPQAAYQVNATGTYNVLEAAVLLEIPQVVFTSTIATYGPDVGTVVDENSLQRPTTMYGVTKTFGELLGSYYLRRFGVDFRGIRLASVIGPGRGPGGASAYSSLIVSEPARGRPFTVPTNEATTMPLLYVKDAVSALIQIAEADGSALRRRVYGVAGFSPTAGELCDAVRDVVTQARIEFQPDPAIMTIADGWPDRLDDSEATEDWGWQPAYGLEATIEDFVAELRAHADWP